MNEPTTPLRLLQAWRVDASSEHPEDIKVFEDVSRRRQVAATLAVVIFACVALVWITEFIWRLSAHSPNLDTINVEAALEGTVPLANTPTFAPTIHLAGASCAARESATAKAGDRRVLAYLPAQDQKARMAFRARCDDVDAVLYEAMRIDRDGGLTLMADFESPGGLARWLGVAKAPPAYAIARPAPDLDGAGLDAILLGMPGARAIAGHLVAAVAQSGSEGACVSLANHPEVSVDAVANLITAWSLLARAAGQGICLIAGPQAAWWTHDAIIDRLDLVVMLAFEVTSRPFAPAPRDYFNDVVLPIVQALPLDRLVLAPGGFGLLWRTGARDPAIVSYADALLWAETFGATPAFSADTGNSRIDFLDQERRRNQIWMLDAVTMEDRLRVLPEVTNIAVWPLGYEDPAVWDVLKGAPDALDRPIDLLGQMAHLGTGPLVASAAAGRIGHRTIARDGQGQPVGVTYADLPLPARLTLHGAGQQGDLTLTFSGLPQRQALAPLLAELRAKDVRATFFLTFNEMLDQPEAITAIASAGHGFGAMLRSFDDTWPGADQLRQMGLRGLGLLLADGVTLGTGFVRDPAGRLTNPSSPDDLLRLVRLIDQGYHPVTPGIAVPGGETDLRLRLEQVRHAAIARNEHLLSIRLSDPEGPGAARWVGDLIDALEQDGFRFVPLSRLIGSEQPLDAIPIAQPTIWRDSASFAVMRFVQDNLALLFVVMLSLDASRSFIYMTLAFLRRKKGGFDPAWTPEVTVLVPAYNEENVIERCLDSLIASDYPHLRIVVIDDGSSDHTAEIVAQRWAQDPRVTLLHEENRGKWHAENYALDRVRTPIFVGVDADTVIQPDAISRLVQQFRDPTVGAVAGFVEVGNPDSYLTRCQALEYLVSQAVGRRAFEVFNGILVVPGALGAWRTEAVRKAGLYASSTITEDADLTVAVHRAGYKVRFEESARAFTEVPMTVGALVRQRIRWSLGMLQTSWKHRRSIREGRAVGYISIVDAIWISFLSSLTAPLVDLLLIVLAVQAGFVLATTGFAAIDVMTLVAVAGYFGLVIVDVLLAAAAFALERRRDVWMIGLVPLLRFGYRQIMVFAALNALWRAITGRLYGWNKLARTGTVHVMDGDVALRP